MVQKMEKITNLQGKLLEGCVWDEILQVLYFIDIEFRKLYQYAPDTETLLMMEMHDYIGCIVLEPSGTLAAAMPDGLYRVNFRQKTAVKIADGGLEWGLRYNDGKCDARGRLWVGSMEISQGDHSRGKGSLYCIERGHIRSRYPGYTVPNGLCWKKDYKTFYHIDTPTRKVDAYAVKDEFVLERAGTAVDLTGVQGVPDGMCMDEEGKLWIAMWGGGRVVCCDAGDGSILRELAVPDRYVSCCTFGGKNMDMLYITTARDETGSGGEVYRCKMQVRGEKAERYGR